MIENWPTKRYATVVIDPPWPVTHNMIDRFTERGGTGKYYRHIQYDMMTLEEIAALPVSSCLLDSAYVFVWTVQKHLPYTFDLLRAWSLTYRYTMVWHKNTGATMFNWPFGNAEFVVVGTVGQPKLIGQNDFKMCFQAANRGHSVKPAEFYNTLARVTPAPRIDIFSRRLIPGFDVWGDEAPTETLECSQFPLFEV